MEETMDRRQLPNADRLTGRRYSEISEFCRKIEKAQGRMVFSMVVNRPSVASDSIELVVLVDDINNVVFDQQVADISVSVSEMAYSSTLPLKCSFMLASAFWNGFKSRDDVTLNLLRDGVIVHDKGFLMPLQDLLVKGKVRPSKESVRVYFVKAEQSMKAADQHVLKAMLDLYWAVLDSAHAAVMVAGLTTPSPRELADTVKRELVARNLIHPRCAEVVERIYSVAKKVMHKELFSISGKEFDAYMHDADFFIKEMDEFVKEHVKERV